MNLKEEFSKRGYYIGPFAAVYAWLAILTAALLNPTWSWTTSALSYLGAPTAIDPWVYDYVAMVPSGLLLGLFAYYLLTVSHNRLEKVGSACFLLGAGLLVGIGIFHQGPYPAGTPYPGQDLHDLFSAWFFLQALLAVLAWGLGLRREGRKVVGLEMVVLALGALVVAGGVLAALGKIPGAVGEVDGVVAIDIWVGLMAFARDPPPLPLEAGEELRVGARRSVLHAVQVPALATVVVGMALFFYGNYYLIANLPGLIFQTISVDTVATRTLTLYIVGFALIVFGAWRWSLVLPRWTGAILLGLVAVVPLVMLTTWFSSYGDGLMTLYFIALAFAFPLAISLWMWRRTGYGVTDRRVLSLPGRSPLHPTILARSDVTSLSLRRTLFHRWFSIGDIIFHVQEPTTTGSLPKVHPVEWKGVAKPKVALEALQRELRVDALPGRRRRVRPALFLVVLAILVPIVLLVAVVPVFTVTDTVNMSCALYLSNTKALEANPWPYIHNVTVPIGRVSFQWWSGSPVWMVIGQLPIGLSYQNTALGSLEPADQSMLTSSGSGHYTSYGGTSFGACIGTSASATVTLQLSYPAPLVWE